MDSAFTDKSLPNASHSARGVGRHAVVLLVLAALAPFPATAADKSSTRPNVIWARGGDWIRASDWAAHRPKKAWQTFTPRDGEKGPITVHAVKARVYTPRDKDSNRPERLEILLVVRSESDAFSGKL